MNRADATFFSCCLFVAIASLLYCCILGFDLPLLRYYPLAHEWSWIKLENVPSQSWYGLQLLSVLPAGVLALLLYAVLRHKAFIAIHLSRGTFRVLGVVTTLVTITCITFLILYEFSRWSIL